MKIFKLISIAVLLMSSSLSFAHSGLRTSVPAKGASLTESPSSIQLEFTGDVFLLNLTLTDTQGNSVEFGFKPSADKLKQFELALPTLKANSYQVDWTVMGNDGHRMSGNFSFTLSFEESASMPSHSMSAESRSHE